MTGIVAAVAHTPLWVWPLFAVMLWLGVRNASTRERALAPMFALPAIVLAIGLFNIATSSGDLTLAIPAFVVSLAIGVAIGWNLVPSDVVPLREQGRVVVPGSAAPLLIVIAVLILRYAIGYTYGRWPELRSDPALTLEFGATGALLAGILWGRALRLVQIYRRPSPIDRQGRS
jgi:teichoic acid transport system permease protein